MRGEDMRAATGARREVVVGGPVVEGSGEGEVGGEPCMVESSGGTGATRLREAGDMRCPRHPRE